MVRYHLLSTKASVQVCRKCGDTVLAGWAEGLFTLCDILLLTVDGTHKCEQSGRTTFTIMAGELVHMGNEREARLGLSMPEHRCAQRVPAHWTDIVDSTQLGT
jgi:hypothetical protein